MWIPREISLGKTEGEGASLPPFAMEGFYVIPKQDRQGVRTAAHIEQKYDLNQDYSKIAKIATDAQKAAEKANNGVSEVKEDVKSVVGRVEELEKTTGFTTDDTLTLSEEGVLSVNRAFAVEADNTLPITSAAVHTEIGNIDVLLQTI